MTDESNLNVVVYYGGGAEILFDGVKKEALTLAIDEEQWTLRRLIKWIQDNRLKGNAELFVKGDSVRPGILVLVNDTDWDLLGQHEYVLKENDQVHFISTLHGG